MNIKLQSQAVFSEIQAPVISLLGSVLTVDGVDYDTANLESNDVVYRDADNILCIRYQYGLSKYSFDQSGVNFDVALTDGQTLECPLVPIQVEQVIQPV